MIGKDIISHAAFLWLFPLLALVLMPFYFLMGMLLGLLNEALDWCVLWLVWWRKLRGRAKA